MAQGEWCVKVQCPKRNITMLGKKDAWEKGSQQMRVLTKENEPYLYRGEPRKQTGQQRHQRAV